MVVVNNYLKMKYLVTIVVFFMTTLVNAAGKH